ncbi:hypothetical protein BTVI_99795 [Pitangus sulphuratus]|nr:hypothetical protein BTVI_99795 [Pitangus sulphuratus]
MAAAGRRLGKLEMSASAMPRPGPGTPKIIAYIKPHQTDAHFCVKRSEAKKDMVDYSWSDEIFVINQRGGEMETVSFQISNSVAEITGLPKDEESSAFQIKLMLDIRSCQLKKMRGFDGCLTMT